MIRKNNKENGLLHQILYLTFSFICFTYYASENKIKTLNFIGHSDYKNVKILKMSKETMI